MSKTQQDHHNDGQRDAAEDRTYNAPHGLLENFLTWSRDGCEQTGRDNDSYREGYTHAQDQKK